MTNFARIIDGVAVDVSDSPGEYFHPDIALQFAEVPGAVQSGWKLVDGLWVSPDPAPDPVPAQTSPVVSPITFKMLFTSAERLAIKAARATNPIIDDFFELLDDPRLTQVDLGLSSVQGALDYIVSEGLLTVERQQQILGGQAS
ncbi:MAG: hypothetical protein RQ757_06880 [Pseudomonadales bacterium]|nr:hypothetical protein [Pseudomonadales bacterium]